MTTGQRMFRRQVVSGCVVAVLLLAMVPAHVVQAASITNRSVMLSTSSGGAAGVVYTFTSDPLPSATPVRSVEAVVCTTASDPCVTPAGFTAAGAGLAVQPTGLGAASSWADQSTAGALRISHASNVASPSGAVSIAWNAVTNPTADNSTFFLRFTTFSDDAYTTGIDSGTVAVSTAEQINLSAQVDETLTFCTGTSGITGSSCAGANGNSVNLGVITPNAAGTGTSQIGVSTNASSGYAITVSGSTLTSGSNTIDALAAQTASILGNEQFGINLRDNTAPNVGVEPAGAGTATPAATYNTADQYRFVSGEVIASKNVPDQHRLFTVAYIANVAAGLTAAGTYTSTLTFVATGTF